MEESRLPKRVIKWIREKEENQEEIAHAGTENDKREKFGRKTMEQAEMAIRDQATAQDVLIRNYIYINI